MQEITIEISPSGETKITTKGFKGSACKVATADIERALGKTISDVPTTEASENARVQSSNRG